MPKAAAKRPSRSASRKTSPLDKTVAPTNHKAIHKNTLKATGKASEPNGKIVGTKGKDRESDLQDSEYAQLLSFVEPSVLVRPSYQEYDEKGHPNSSTAQMLPLGTMPPPTYLKQTLGKTSKPGGRQSNINGKNAAGGKKGENGGNKSQQSNGLTNALETSGSSPSTPNTGIALNLPPTSKTPEGRLALGCIIHAALERSASVGHNVVGRALKKLYEESLTNPQLAELFDVVMGQRATQDQITAFQAHIRTARETIETIETEDCPSQIVEGTETAASAYGYAKAGKIASTNKRGRRSTKGNGLSELSADVFGSASSTLILGSEPSTPPTNEIFSSGANSEDVTKELTRLDEKMEEFRKSMVKGDGPIRSSNVRPDPVGTAVRGSTKEATNTNPRKRAREPEVPETPPPQSEGANAGSSILEAPDLGGPSKKRRQGGRVKTSPMKSKTSNTSSGNATAIGSNHVRFASEAVSENEDICCVCNGPGKFLCCDRCPRSFHFSCIEPPVDEDNIPEDSWFCKMCTAQMTPPPKHPRGLFSTLLDNIDRRNPQCFSLPDPIKTYFAGVQSGQNGEYIELQDSKPTKRGTVVEPDPFQTRDKNGDVIICFKCKDTALGNRMIHKCDFCELYWHLDCVNPPMANPPHASRKWMCPAHAEQGLLQPRRPRNAKIVDTYLTRGHKNNGYIEIENSDSESESGFVEHESDGVVYRLPERGIKLDFIDKVKVERTRKNPFGDDRPSDAGLKRQKTGDVDMAVATSRGLRIVDESAALISAHDRSSEEIDAIQGLQLMAAQFLQNPSATGKELDELIDALVAVAPPEIHSELTQESPMQQDHHLLAAQPSDPLADGHPEQHRRKLLTTILELCQKRLAMMGGLISTT